MPRPRLRTSSPLVGEGFASYERSELEAKGEGDLRPLLLPLLGDEMPEHGIHPPLIAGAAALEIIEHILVEPDRDRLLPRRLDKHRLRPVEIERHGVGVAPHRVGDRLVGQSVDGGPVSLPRPAIVPRDPRGTSAVRRGAPGARR